MSHSMTAPSTLTNSASNPISLKTQAGSYKSDVLKALQRYRIVGADNHIVDGLVNLGLSEAERVLCGCLNAGGDCYIQDEEPAYQKAFVVVNAGVHQGQCGFVVKDLKDNYLSVKLVKNGCRYVFLTHELDYVGLALSDTHHGVEAVISVVDGVVAIVVEGECDADMSQIIKEVGALVSDDEWPTGFTLSGKLFAPESLPAYFVIESPLVGNQEYYIAYNCGGYCVDQRTGTAEYHSGVVIFDTLRLRR
ncbi:hypothetical protein L2748_23415 [Shewanella sairae]|uniref:hypothetical protein n=1 Tax=Shewanella sairae TaxID=190310 RepID=UPI00200F62B4|nr:hypothetical protein [Shewanella sairae]MCL1132615.1 hypothetical protein [Shewanella sairae]